MLGLKNSCVLSCGLHGPSLLQGKSMSPTLDRLIRNMLAAGLAVILITASAVLLAAAKPPGRDYWPTQNWRSAYPETQGMDSSKLLKVMPFIKENLPDIRSLLVVRHGYIVFENYYAMGAPDRQDTVHSVTKSITSILFGIARDQGLIGSLDKTLYDYLPNYFDASAQNDKKSITLKHLLTMTAGLQPIRVTDRRLWLAWRYAPDRTRFTLDLPMIQTPGKRFAYSNAVSHLLSVVLTKTAGVPLWDFAARNLFNPLGIRPRLWKTDAQGFNSGGSGLYLCARDMAKIGYLYLNQGQWNGKQIVSAQWVAESTRRQVSAARDYGYGYQWWTRDVAGCPAYLAWGLNGQFIVVVPRMDLVIVVTSRTSMPRKPSGHYVPLFDIVAEAVLDEACNSHLREEKNTGGNKNSPPELQNFSAVLPGRLKEK